MIKVGAQGDFKKTVGWIERMLKRDIYNGLDNLAQRGVAALADNTPYDSGMTAKSWGYDIFMDRDEVGITWYNTNQNQGVNIAIILQYGHATGTGGYVAGLDYINPAMRPIFDQIADEVWEQVKNG